MRWREDCAPLWAKFPSGADLPHRGGRGTVGGGRNGGSSAGADADAGTGGARNLLPAGAEGGGAGHDGGGAAP